MLAMNVSHTCIYCRILSHPNIPLENKKPFVGLLTWAFIETERDSLVYLTHLSKSQ